MSGLLAELFQAGIYKRSQGRITRQVTFGALVGGLAIGCWRLHHVLTGEGWEGPAQIVNVGIPLFLLAAGAWVSYRLVNLPSFADFLISVEAEMNKVSWPTRGELFRSSLVVLITIFVMVGLLFFFDNLWLLVIRGFDGAWQWLFGG